MRVYRQAFEKTPQHAREWIMLAELDSSRRSAALLITALKNFASGTPRQPASAPKVFDYAELVRQRVRPNIVWNGKTGHRETVVGTLHVVRESRVGHDRSIKWRPGVGQGRRRGGQALRSDAAR
ncbi:hypothetical protein OKW33_000390 [Paraburkholderia atlantica]